MDHALVIEDHDLMRRALIHELRGRLRNAMIAGASSLDVAKGLLKQHAFNVVVIDPGLPGYDPTSRQDRFRIVRSIVEASPSAMHIVITGSDNREEAKSFGLLGIRSYLGKTGLQPGQLSEVLEEIETGEYTVRLSSDANQTAEMLLPYLGPRENEVIVSMMCREPGVKRIQVFEEIARKYNISSESVEKYYKTAKVKLKKAGCLPKDL
ncbi:MAG: response regulator transcription factor [Rhizobiaceae bacterium]|nr:response regulator transcription factor [Rhizobiaceae bacterium]